MSEKPPPTLDDLRARRDEILRVAEKHGASNVRIFGSVARGEATADSDIDLMVTMSDGVSIFDLVGLWLDIKDLLGYEVSLVTDDPHPTKERLMRRIMKDVIPL